MSRFKAAALLLCALSFITAPFVQAEELFKIHSGGDYLVEVPKGCSFWVLAPKAQDASWYYLSRDKCDESGKAISSASVAELPHYRSRMRVTAGDTTECCAFVANSEISGWIAKPLLTLTPEQQRIVDAARDKARKLEKERQAKDQERQAKERAYVASLPKLWNNGADVLVATSMDCAKDYQGIVRFGREKGTGVAFRKRIAELVSLGCAILVPSHTAILIRTRTSEFVSFTAYDGPFKGRSAIALKEHVK
jgi:hypothetical protein